jgi:hypothetical protein
VIEDAFEVKPEYFTKVEVETMFKSYNEVIAQLRVDVNIQQEELKELRKDHTLSK